MTDSERIEALEKQVAALEKQIAGLSGRSVNYGGYTGTFSRPECDCTTPPCGLTPHTHHYTLPNGSCICQAHTWAR